MKTLLDFAQCHTGAGQKGNLVNLAKTLEAVSRPFSLVVGMGSCAGPAPLLQTG